MAGVAIIVPMLRRPHRVRPVYQSAISNTPDARIVFVVSADDPPVVAECTTLLGEHQGDASCVVLRVPWQGGTTGDYARKINWAYERTSEPFLFLGADDLAFHPGWYEAARAHLDHAGVVGTNDLGNERVMRGEHATHSLVARAYVDRWGTIDEPRKVLHEGYVHEFVDDEFVGTARHRNLWAFAADSIVEHLHPHWGKAPTDELYEAQAARMRRSRVLYQRRRRLWT